MNNPNTQDRNLAEAEEIVKSSWQDGKDILKANARLITAFAQALSKTQQETVKGCLEAHETARGQLCLKHADDDCDCDYCYHFHSAVKEINLKYQTKE